MMRTSSQPLQELGHDFRGHSRPLLCCITGKRQLCMYLFVHLKAFSGFGLQNAINGGASATTTVYLHSSSCVCYCVSTTSITTYTVGPRRTQFLVQKIYLAIRGPYV